MRPETFATLVPNPDLVFRFFAFFSRFEYALKRSGFLLDKHGRAEPAWDNYANSLHGQFASIRDDAFEDALSFLLNSPPRRQVVNSSQLEWVDTHRGQGEHDENYILRLVRIVRNNLFHGSKYAIPGGPVDDPARDERLLTLIRKKISGMHLGD